MKGSPTIEELLTIRHDKDETILYLKLNPGVFDDALDICLTDKEPLCWRSAWMIGHVMDRNDERIQPWIDRFIDVLPSKKDGHQRELIKILLQMELDEG